MKALKHGIGGVLAAGLALIAACGGSTDDNGGSPSGAAGSGGKASGAAGTSSTNTGGTTGSPGQMNNPDCPATAPANATACTLTGTQSTCAYTGTSCACVRTGGGTRPGGGMAGATGTSTRQWECVATLVCPATKPTAGDACTPAEGMCRYAGMGSCSCSTRSSKWSCSGGITGAGGGFNGAGGGFNGAGGAFTGFAGAFTGVAGAFTGFGGRTGGGTAGDTSGGTTCPATKPAADGACTGTGACPYEGGGCVCSNDKWTCL